MSTVLSNPGTVPEDSSRIHLVERRFTTVGEKVLENVAWELRNAEIKNAQGETIFEQKNVKVPKAWSQTATNIVASKYFWGKPGTPQRERGVDQLVSRVAETIAQAGLDQGYFQHGTGQYDAFVDELSYILVNQLAAFNSPVWFNVGLDRYEPDAQAAHWSWDRVDNVIRKANTGYNTPQCSACFINSVKDAMESIMELARTEVMLFKFGSGTGTNLSPLRSSKEQVSGGGVASGPLSFMKGFDAFAGVIKSGGKTRRAAKMTILNVDHPDIQDFIWCKSKEEKKAYALMREGYDGSSGPDSEAYQSIFYQNANNSVRVTDEFMQAAHIKGGKLELKAVTDGRTVEEVDARQLLNEIAQAAWECGDPGMQYDTTINRWHTSKNSGRINSSNPCSEYMFLDDSACNLSSINLLKFLDPDGTFDVQGFKHTVDIMILAQDILVDLSGYPTEAIARNSHDYRPLGLGYANLGALLMVLGLPYDSDEGRAYAAAVTSVMGGEAYAMSARIARAMPALRPAGADLVDSYELAGGVSFSSGMIPARLNGACPGFAVNDSSFYEVIRMHQNAAEKIPVMPCIVPADLRSEAEQVWVDARDFGRLHGFRNAQVTVLAPTGTIGFLMDCDTTGIEPELGLIKFKKLVGGGVLKIVNDRVREALVRLGYKNEVLNAICKHVEETGTVEGCEYFDDADLPVFDTSFKPAKGTRSIHHLGHLRMMAAVQPFLSGAISKTINMPSDATVEDVANAYIEGWKLGLKAIAIYRDGCKANQVLVTSMDTKKDELKDLTRVELVVPEPDDLNAPPRAVRHRLPDDRNSITHKFSIAGHEGYLIVGMYPSGQPGEIFITMAKEGSTISGLMDGFALMMSIALQHGVPLQSVIDKFAHTRFEPSGFTHNKEIGYAKSILDYIARFLKVRFVDAKQHNLFPGMNIGGPVVATSGETHGLPTLEPVNGEESLSSVMELGDSPSCSFCGSIMVRNGSCYKCIECGSTSGCS